MGLIVIRGLRGRFSIRNLGSILPREGENMDVWILEILLIFGLMGTAGAEDPPMVEDPPFYFVEPPQVDAVGPDQPIVFPEPMQQAAQALTNAVSNGWDEEQAVQATHRAFLGNDSLNLSNASLFYA